MDSYTLILGIWLLQNAHISMIIILFSLSKGQIDSKRFYDAQSAYFVGAILLIVPAIFSDILGVISLIYLHIVYNLVVKYRL